MRRSLHLAVHAVHLPGKLNERADIISRRRVERSETSLNPDLLPDLEALHGPITCDLFAGRHNRLAERFFSPTQDFASAATDAFNQNLCGAHETF